ncbi:MAG: hypothetical protein ACLQLC_15935 [Candidatus Sulfotelmatobacter sp.]
MNAHSIRSSGHPTLSLRAAARFWERYRIFYNVVLVTVTWFWLACSWPHFRAALTLAELAKVLALALIGNVLYSAAYIAEPLIQQASQAWQRRFRWILWAVGTLIAAAAASYWINDEIYPDFARVITFIRSVTLC